MKSALNLLLVLLLAGGLTFLVVNPPAHALLSSGGAPDFYASSPASFYANCTACHDNFAVNSGNGGMEISGLPPEYTPGATYTVEVRIGDPGQQRWGYELTALDDGDQPIGTFSNPDANSQISNAGAGLQFVKQNSGGDFDGTFNGPVSWTVDWTAPAAGAGKARFYASGNAANSAQGRDGDFIYNTATSTSEAGALQTDGTIIGQPNSVNLQAGVDRLIVPMRVTNHEATTQRFFVVTRVRKPNGTFFPSTGWLTGPTPVDLMPGETTTVILNKPVKASTPPGTYQVQCIIGRQGNTLVNRDLIDVQVF